MVSLSRRAAKGCGGIEAGGTESSGVGGKDEGRAGSLAAATLGFLVGLARPAVGECLRLLEHFERFFNREQHCRLARLKRAARSYANREGGRRDVVWALDQHIAVVLPEAVPKAVQFSADRLDESGRDFPAVLRLLDELGPRVWRVAEAHEVERHGHLLLVHRR